MPIWPPARKWSAPFSCSPTAHTGPMEGDLLKRLIFGLEWKTKEVTTSKSGYVKEDKTWPIRLQNVKTNDARKLITGKNTHTIPQWVDLRHWLRPGPWCSLTNYHLKNKHALQFNTVNCNEMFHATTVMKCFMQHINCNTQKHIITAPSSTLASAPDVPCPSKVWLKALNNRHRRGNEQLAIIAN